MDVTLRRRAKATAERLRDSADSSASLNMAHSTRQSPRKRGQTNLDRRADGAGGAAIRLPPLRVCASVTISASVAAVRRRSVSSSSNPLAAAPLHSSGHSCRTGMPSLCRQHESPSSAPEPPAEHDHPVEGRTQSRTRLRRDAAPRSSDLQAYEADRERPHPMRIGRRNRSQPYEDGTASADRHICCPLCKALLQRMCGQHVPAGLLTASEAHPRSVAMHGLSTAPRLADSTGSTPLPHARAATKAAWAGRSRRRVLFLISQSGSRLDLSTCTSWPTFKSNAA